MLSGLVISIGGLQDSLRKASLSAFLEYLQVDEDINNESKGCKLSEDILWILQEYKRCDRVIVPTLKVTEPLDNISAEKKGYNKGIPLYVEIFNLSCNELIMGFFFLFLF